MAGEYEIDVIELPTSHLAIVARAPNGDILQEIDGGPASSGDPTTGLADWQTDPGALFSGRPVAGQVTEGPLWANGVHINEYQAKTFGTLAEMQPYLEAARKAIDEINNQIKPYDPTGIFGWNSNSVASSVLQAMGLTVPLSIVLSENCIRNGLAR
jgi:hypothetical protein